ncbi:MAG TPA: SdiA-regulated domain-containing protein [Polyangiaceae bacterium]|nr:SdiA-regulated domain-containing protein [Polyangiaceae bacterium]
MDDARSRFGPIRLRCSALVCVAACLTACGADTERSGSASGDRANAGSGGANGGRLGNGGSGGGRPGTAFAEYVPEGPPVALDGVVNASDIAWKPTTDTFFVLADRVSELYEYEPDFRARRRTIALVNPPEDAEGLSYVRSLGTSDRLVLSTEAPTNMAWVFDLDESATTLDFATAVRQRYEPIGASKVPNRGLEGVALRANEDGTQNWLYVCEEGEPQREPIRVLRFAYDEGGQALETYRDGSLSVEEPFVASALFDSAVGDLSGLHYDGATGTLLITSHLGSRLLRVDPDSGQVWDQMLLTRSPQYEGVTLASGNRLVVVSEPNWVEIFRGR